MLTLAFDTSLDKTYVALSDGETILSSKIVANTDTNYHSAFLISTIKEILNEHSAKPKDLGLIATNVGPGSFTGIRACTTVARVIAQQLNLKTISVSSLEILSRLNNTSKRTLVLLDARKNKAYVWDKEIIGAVLIDDIKEMLKNDDYHVICDDSMYKVFSELTSDIVSYTTIEHNFGEIIIELCKTKLPQDWEKLTPLYIQPPPVF